jgi:hypothetical protein
MTSDLDLHKKYGGNDLFASDFLGNGLQYGRGFKNRASVKIMFEFSPISGRDMSVLGPLIKLTLVKSLHRRIINYCVLFVYLDRVGEHPPCRLCWPVAGQETRESAEPNPALINNSVISENSIRKN